MSDSPVEIMAVPVVSTCHLSREEGQRKAEAWPTHCHESTYGFIVYVGHASDLRSVISEGDGPALWPGLLAAAAWAEKHGMEWIRFDADGPEQPGLPVWGW